VRTETLPSLIIVEELAQIRWLHENHQPGAHTGTNMHPVNLHSVQANLSTFLGCQVCPWEESCGCAHHHLPGACKRVVAAAAVADGVPMVIITSQVGTKIKLWREWLKVKKITEITNQVHTMNNV
jgi:hypothetical protein